jgi:hypothetical protein
MRTTPPFLRSFLLAFVLSTLTLAASAETVQHREEFLTWQYRDPALTTADWDTLQGQLALFPVGLDSLGRATGGGQVFASAAHQGELYLADGNSYLFCLDPTDPADPQLLDSFSTLSGVRDLVLDGNWAYLSVGTSGVQTVNIADPGDLVEGGGVDLPGFAYGLVKYGANLYVAQSGNGLGIVDVSTPWQPALTASIPTRDWARDTALTGDLLLVADSGSGLTVMDLAQPASPVIIGAHETSATCWSVTADGDRAYLALGTAGMEIVDIANPGLPVSLGTLSFPGNANCRHLSARGDTLFAAVNDAGLFVVDISEPTTPAILGQFNSPGTAYHTSLDGEVIWLADGSEGAFSLALDPLALDGSRNTGQSLNLASAEEPVTRARLSAVVQDSVRFELTHDGGSTWWPAANDGDWVDFPEPGQDLRWRATLVLQAPGDFPSCSELVLTYDRLHGYGGISAVSDVPGDTGGQVRVSWDASRFDAAGSEHTVTEYSLYRRFAPGSGLASVAKAPAPDLPYPPGSWDYLTSIPADRETSYSVVVPTLADSSVVEGMHWSVFFVRTRTSQPGTFFDSPPDSGYSLNNLAPAPPTGFRMDHQPGSGTLLVWHEHPDPDFAHFRLYRTTVPVSAPSPAHLFQVTTGTRYLDTAPGTWYYQLTAVNLAGHESEAASAVSAVPVAGQGLTLYPGTPNPFNPRTSVRLEVPETGLEIRFVVHDLKGRLVRVLHHGWLPSGPHEFVWDGLDQDGRAVGSGVYFARAEGGNLPLVVKMLLVR